MTVGRCTGMLMGAVGFPQSPTATASTVRRPQLWDRQGFSSGYRGSRQGNGVDDDEGIVRVARAMSRNLVFS